MFRHSAAALLFLGLALAIPQNGHAQDENKKLMLATSAKFFVFLAHEFTQEFLPDQEFPPPWNDWQANDFNNLEKIDSAISLEFNLLEKMQRDIVQREKLIATILKHLRDYQYEDDVSSLYENQKLLLQSRREFLDEWEQLLHEHFGKQKEAILQNHWTAIQNAKAQANRKVADSALFFGLNAFANPKNSLEDSIGVGLLAGLGSAIRQDMELRQTIKQSEQVLQARWSNHLRVAFPMFRVARAKLSPAKTIPINQQTTRKILETITSLAQKEAIHFDPAEEKEFEPPSAKNPNSPKWEPQKWLQNTRWDPFRKTRLAQQSLNFSDVKQLQEAAQEILEAIKLIPNKPNEILRPFRANLAFQAGLLAQRACKLELQNLALRPVTGPGPIKAGVFAGKAWDILKQNADDVLLREEKVHFGLLSSAYSGRLTEGIKILTDLSRLNPGDRDFKNPQYWFDAARFTCLYMKTNLSAKNPKHVPVILQLKNYAFHYMDRAKKCGMNVSDLRECPDFEHLRLAFQAEFDARVK